MGNEVLHHESSEEYPPPQANNETAVRVREHTVTRVLGCLDKSGIAPPDTTYDIGQLNAADVFCGYLMLDALISNQDRHHENWAIVVCDDTGKKYLCPTYDHAASLGRELKDAERIERIKTKDSNRTIDRFIHKARSELFKLKRDAKPMLTVDAFFTSIEKRPQAQRHWKDKLSRLDEQKIKNVFSKIPKIMITEIASEFAVEMVLRNKQRLLNDERF